MAELSIEEVNSLIARRTSRYSEMLDKLDIDIAEKDRSRRKLAKERTKVEKELDRIGEVVERFSSIDADLTEFSSEEEALRGQLREIDLAIARLDRARRDLKKERRTVEPWAS